MSGRIRRSLGPLIVRLRAHVDAVPQLLGAPVDSSKSEEQVENIQCLLLKLQRDNSKVQKLVDEWSDVIEDLTKTGQAEEEEILYQDWIEQTQRVGELLSSAEDYIVDLQQRAERYNRRELLSKAEIQAKLPSAVAVSSNIVLNSTLDSRECDRDDQDGENDVHSPAVIDVASHVQGTPTSDASMPCTSITGTGTASAVGQAVGNPIKIHKFVKRLPDTADVLEYDCWVNDLGVTMRDLGIDPGRAKGQVATLLGSQFRRVWDGLRMQGKGFSAVPVGDMFGEIFPELRKLIFPQKSHGAMYKELLHLYQKPNQTVAHYRMEVTRIVEEMLPHDARESKDSIIYHQMMEGLLPELKMLMETKHALKHNSLQEFLGYLATEESVYVSTKAMEEMRQKSPKKKADVLPSGDKRDPPSGERKTMNCYHCNKPGHAIKDCKVPCERCDPPHQKTKAECRKLRGPKATAGREAGSGRSGGYSSKAVETAEELEKRAAEQRYADFLEEIAQSSTMMVKTSSSSPVAYSCREFVDILAGDGKRLCDPILGLLDTGSGPTIFSKDLIIPLLQKFPDAIQTRPARTSRVRDASGNSLVIMSEVLLNLRLPHGKVVPMWVQVQGGNVYKECLLGREFLHKSDFTFERKIPKGPPVTYLRPLPMVPEPDKKGQSVCLVTMDDTCYFHEARTSEVKVSFGIPLQGDLAPDEGYLVQAEDEMSGRGLLIDEVFVRSDCPANVKLCVSSSTAPALLQKDELVAVAEKVTIVPPDQVSLFLEQAQAAAAEMHDGLITDKEERESAVDHDQRIADICGQLVMDGLQEEARLKLMKLVGEWEQLFALSSEELGETDLVEHQIILQPGETPVRQGARRLNLAYRDTVRNQIQDLLKQAVITESSSPYCSPLVIVRKKDGSLRICVDYRALNAITKKDRYPLPRVDDIIDSMGSKKVFSSLDLFAGYWQIRLDADAEEKSAFTTPFGQYSWRRMPFGLCNAPATFQRLMNVVLREYIGVFCSVYLDDIIIYSDSIEEHLQHLDLVFRRLFEAGLRLKPSKCKLLQSEVQYLGHVISADGIKVDPAKVQNVIAISPPKTVTELRSFLGLVGYYRRFIKDYAKIAQPLYGLLKKERVFEWGDAQGAAFETLKSAVCSAKVLAYPDLEKVFILNTDASGSGFGAVLSQQDDEGKVRPVAFAARSLSSGEEKYTVTELEMKALYWACRHFRPYIEGKRTVVYTDHQPLVSIKSKRELKGNWARWVCELDPFDLDVRYKPGRSNVVADVLSRQAACAVEQKELAEGEHDSIAKEQKSDPELLAMFEFLANGTLPTDELQKKKLNGFKSNLHLLDGVIRFEDGARGRDAIVVPKHLRETLLKENHTGFGGHPAEERMVNRMRLYYWWPKMKQDVKDWCRGCFECGLARGSARRKKPPLKLPVTPNCPWEVTSIDLTEFKQVSCRGNKHVLVVLDTFSKWVEAIPIPDKRAETVCDAIHREILCRYSVRSFTSDRGSEFCNELLDEVCSRLGIEKNLTSGYHPQANPVERVNRKIKEQLRVCAQENPMDWEMLLPQVLWADRATPHTTTGESPYFVLFGYDPVLPSETSFREPRTVYQTIDMDDYGSNLFEHQRNIWNQVYEKIEKMKAAYKKYYDQRVNAEPSDIRPGDRVFVYKPSLGQGKLGKLTSPFDGLFRVESTTETGANVRPIFQKGKTADVVHVHFERLSKADKRIPDTWRNDLKRRRRRAKSPALQEPTVLQPSQHQYNTRGQSK